MRFMKCKTMYKSACLMLGHHLDIIFLFDMMKLEVKRGVRMEPQWILDFGIGSCVARDENFFSKIRHNSTLRIAGALPNIGKGTK
jgi:hypothetical protein